MEHFEHVMVLISVIIGLGIAHVLLGLARIIDRIASGVTLHDFSSGHLIWLAHTFFWMLLFWWWQFRALDLELEWTLGLYLFLVMYSVALFLMAVILVPLTVERALDFRTFFLERRRWFYGLFLFATVLDAGEGYVKGGWDRVLEQGPWIWSLWLIALPIAVIGYQSSQQRHHAVMAAIYLVLQITVSAIELPTLDLS